MSNEITAETPEVKEAAHVDLDKEANSQSNKQDSDGDHEEHSDGDHEEHSDNETHEEHSDNETHEEHSDGEHEEHSDGEHEEHDEHHDEHHHDAAELDMFGFWVYIMSDCMLFATMFATYVVLSMNKTGQVDPASVLDLKFVAVETSLLLLSSFTFGMGMLGAYAKNVKKMVFWLGFTWLLGAGFIVMELYEFNHLLHVGASPANGGYWSGFFGLIGTHGIHVTAGLIWMIVLLFHFKRDGLSDENMTRLSMLSLFWHFLDIIWICVFSIVYLLGALQ